MMSNKDIPGKQVQAKFVGFTYLITTIIGLINSFYMKVGAQNPTVLLESEFQFRTAQMPDLLMFILVMWMAHALYLTTKSINKSAAQLGFIFRLGEGIFGFVVVLFTFIPLVVLKSSNAMIFNDEELNSLATIFFSVKRLGWSITFILMSIGALIFMYLFTKSSYIPKWLGYRGLFTYITVLVSFTLQLLIPDSPKKLMIVMAPGALFELTFGIWFLVKGINIKTAS